MKVEKSLQTLLTRTARSWSNCLRPAVCDGHKLTQKKKAEKIVHWVIKVKPFQQPTRTHELGGRKLQEIELLSLILLSKVRKINAAAFSQYFLKAFDINACVII